MELVEIVVKHANFELDHIYGREQALAHICILNDRTVVKGDEALGTLWAKSLKYRSDIESMLAFAPSNDFKAFYEYYHHVRQFHPYLLKEVPINTPMNVKGRVVGYGWFGYFKDYDNKEGFKPITGFYLDLAIEVATIIVKAVKASITAINFETLAQMAESEIFPRYR